jgi:hypothetical protein
MSLKLKRYIFDDEKAKPTDEVKTGAKNNTPH